MPASNGDHLKTPNEAYLPDDRSSAFGLASIEDQYNRIRVYDLADYVPEKIATQYEISRNLYLYSYNVYRFYMVAQHQVLVTMELAIKKCIGTNEIER